MLHFLRITQAYTVEKEMNHASDIDKITLDCFFLYSSELQIFLQHSTTAQYNTQHYSVLHTAQLYTLYVYKTQFTVIHSRIH